MNAFASLRSLVTTTPLPPANTSRFTTHGWPENSSKAASTSEVESSTWKAAVGTPAVRMTCLA